MQEFHLGLLQTQGPGPLDKAAGVRHQPGHPARDRLVRQPPAAHGHLQQGPQRRGLADEIEFRGEKAVIARDQGRE